MRIYHNIPALTAYNSLNSTNSAMEKTIQKLSTGLRINSAADDAAGFAISEKMRAQISGLEVAIRNTQDATSMLQVAEGALGETNSMLQRMRELAVQASNDTLTSQDRSYIQLEIDQLEDQIDRIAKTTQFNKKRLLDGSSAGITSSSNLSVKAYVRGSLREIDQFGQKKSFEGNYKIQVKVDPSQTGSGQVQKSSVMTIKHPNVITDVNVDNGIQKVAVDNVPAGDYSITRASSDKIRAKGVWSGDDFVNKSATASDSDVKTAIQDNFNIDGSVNSLKMGDLNAKIKFEVGTVDTTTAGQEKVDITATLVDEKGNTMTDDSGNALTITHSFDGADADTLAWDLSKDLAQDGLGLGKNAGDCVITLTNAQLTALTGAVAEGTEFAYTLGAQEQLSLTNLNNTNANLSNSDVKNAINSTIDILFAYGDEKLKGATIKFEVTAAPVTTTGSESVALTATLTDKDGNTSTSDYTFDSSNLNWDLSTGLGLTAASITLDAAKLTTLAGAVAKDTTFEYSLNDGNGAASKLTGFYNAGSATNEEALGVINFESDDSQRANASVLFEVTSIDKTNGSVTLRATSNVLGVDGNVSNYLEDAIIVTANEKGIGDKLGLGSADACKLSINAADIDKLEVGTKFTYNYTAAGRSFDVSATQDKNWPDKWGNEGDNVTCDDKGSYTGGNPITFGLNESRYDLNSKAIHFRNFYINGENGSVYEGDVILTTKDTYNNDVAEAENADKLVSFTAAYIGKTATLDTKLRDINTFWNSSGVFMLDNPQTLTINQGDGKSATVTIYGTDTIRELQAKFNDAIGRDLGQAQYVQGDGASRFCTFVEKGSESTQGLETVPGTFIFRSVLPGTMGDLTFSGDEDLINTFALNVVQNSSTAAFRASIYDAHTGIAVNGATNVKVSDNKLVGVLHPNVDIEFDATANIKATWSDAEKNFILEPETDSYEAIIHIVDSSTIFQIGANEGEDIAIDIGNMSAGSLGVTNINVSTRESASKSIGMIDAAINKVSSQRAKIGAYQNALDYTSENLTTTMTNLTAAESRIRDADMAQTMMEFVKLQILNQSGTSMLAQANQLPQSVMSLLQG